MNHTEIEQNSAIGNYFVKNRFRILCGFMDMGMTHTRANNVLL